MKARILSQYGRHDEASAEIEVALRLDPESYEVNKSAAYLHLRQHELHDAIRFYEKAMTLMETDVNSPSMLLTCYGAVGDSEGARACRAHRACPCRKAPDAGSEQRRRHGLRRDGSRRPR